MRYRINHNSETFIGTDNNFCLRFNGYKTEDDASFETKDINAAFRAREDIHMRWQGHTYEVVEME